jgi:enoyl-CoA hydratase/carnithine racemase
VRPTPKKHQGFPVPKCIEAHGKDNKPFEVPVVLREDRDGIAVLTIRRPKVLNALDQSVFDEIAPRASSSAISRPDREGHRADRLRQEGVRVSGADVNFLAKIDSVAMGEKTSRTSQVCVDAVQAVQKPWSAR